MSNKDVKVGDVFGKLKIIKLLGYDKWRKNKLAKCICACGKKSVVQITSLKTGHTKSCGKCNRVEVGDVCGKWKVIEEVGVNKNNGRMMRCRCECGNESIVAATQLGTGRSKSCGKCYRPEIGDSYGQLTVIAEGGKDSANRRRVKCQCTCGRTTIVDAYNLTSGISSTCGRCNETLFRKVNKISYGILADGTEFYFDTKFLSLVKKHQWHCDADSYIKTPGKNGGRAQALHRLLIKAPKNKVVDHIDGNPRNNLLKNLRLCTTQQNIFNSKLSKNNTSGYTGVRQTKSGKYSAVIMFNRKTIYLGRYTNIYDAAMIRNEAAKLLFGEFARLNGMPDAPAHVKRYVYEKCKNHLPNQNLLIKKLISRG